MAIIIFRIMLFLLPFILFVMWVRYTKKHKEKDGVLDPETQKKIQLGSIIGIILFLAGMLYFGLSRPQNTESDYSPPVLEGGKIKPGTLTPQTEKPQT